MPVQRDITVDLVITDEVLAGPWMVIYLYFDGRTAPVRTALFFIESYPWVDMPEFRYYCVHLFLKKSRNFRVFLESDSQNLGPKPDGAEQPN